MKRIILLLLCTFAVYPSSEGAAQSRKKGGKKEKIVATAKKEGYKEEKNKIYTKYEMASLDSVSEKVQNVIMSGVGVSYTRKINPLNIAGEKGNSYVSLGYTAGRIDYKSIKDGSGDGEYNKVAFGIGVRKDVSAFQGLYVQGNAGVERSTYTKSYFPKEKFYYPITVEAGFKKDLAGVTLIPTFTPSVAYYSSTYEGIAEDSSGYTNVDTGMDLSYTAGLSIKLGKLIVGGEYVLQDNRYYERPKAVIKAGLAF